MHSRESIDGWAVQESDHPKRTTYTSTNTNNFITEVSTGPHPTLGDYYVSVSFTSSSALANKFRAFIKEKTGENVFGRSCLVMAKTGDEIRCRLLLVNEFMRLNSSAQLPETLIEHASSLTSSKAHTNAEKATDEWQVVYNNSAKTFIAPKDSSIDDVFMGPGRGIAYQVIFRVKAAFRIEFEEFIKKRNGARIFVHSFGKQIGVKEDLDSFFATIRDYLSTTNESIPEYISEYAYREFKTIFDNNTKSRGYEANLKTDEPVTAIRNN